MAHIRARANESTSGGPSLRPLLVLVLVLLAAVAHGESASVRLHVLGTGRVVGLYYPVGGAVSHVVNARVDETLLTVKVTAGSVENLEGLERGELSLALAQSDVLYHAYHGQGAFAPRPRPDLRALMGLHPEPLHLVCRRDAGVTGLEDLAGRAVAVGELGSGVRTTVRAVLGALGLDEQRDLEPRYDPADALPRLMAEGTIDCFFYTVGIGGAAIRAAAALQDVALVPLDAPELRALVAARPYYALVTVPGGTYRGVPEDVTLLGVRAVLVATERLEPETAYRLTDALLEGFGMLRETFPAALAGLRLDEVTLGLGVPLHAGARRAYLRRGIRLAP